MNSFGGRLNTRFSFDNSSRSLVSNDNKNEERKWDLFEFNNGVESPKQSFITPFYTSPFTSTNPNQFLDPPFFSFNSNVSFPFIKKVLIFDVIGLMGTF